MMPQQRRWRTCRSMHGTCVCTRLLVALSDGAFYSASVLVVGLPTTLRAATQARCPYKKVCFVANNACDILTCRVAFQIVSFVAIFIVISICLSSLVSATIVSVHQQAPEIGLLQALGLNRAQLYRVYLYETTVHVFIAGLLGGIIGVGMSWLIGTFSNSGN